MRVDQYGRAEISEQEAVSALYNGKISDLKNVYLTDPESIDQYNRSRTINADRIPVLESLEKLDISIEDFDKQNQNIWFMPKDYFPNLTEWLFEQCRNEEETARVKLELELFAQYNMMELLCYIKYLVDTMRKERIVWGVGRGSSVASYVLFLIGIHKVNSLKYNLDIREFLK